VDALKLVVTLLPIERDKDNPVGSAQYYAEIDEVFACRDCDATWRNLSRW
jgi:hypothetical protein